MVSTVALLLLPWLSISYEAKPKFCGLVFSALHNFMPTCFLLHSPPPNLGQKCVCVYVHVCAHRHAHREFLLWSVISPLLPQGTMNFPSPVTSATLLRLRSHHLEPQTLYRASVMTCLPWPACLRGFPWPSLGNALMRSLLWIMLS